MPKAGARAVILSPTRELALQTHKVVKELARFTDLRLAGAYARALLACCCCFALISMPEWHNCKLGL